MPPAAVWGAGPAREAGTARWDAPETSHSWGGRGPGCKTRGPGRAWRTSVPTPAEPCSRSFEFSDEGWVFTLQVTRPRPRGERRPNCGLCSRPRSADPPPPARHPGPPQHPTAEPCFLNVSRTPLPLRRRLPAAWDTWVGFPVSAPVGSPGCSQGAHRNP